MSIGNVQLINCTILIINIIMSPNMNYFVVVDTTYTINIYLWKK